MRARFRRLGGLTVAVCLVTALLTGAVSDTVLDKQRQLRGLNGRISVAKSQLRQLVDRENQLKQQIASFDNQLVTIAEQIQQETAKLELIAIQIEITTRDLAVKRAQLKQHLDDYGQRMRQMYKSGQVDGLELVLSAANFSDLLNRVFFFSDIIRDDRRQADNLRLEQIRVEGVKTELDAKRAEQAQVVVTIQQQQAALRSARSQRLAAQAQVQAIEAQLKQQLDAMQAQRAALQAQLARLRAESLRARSSGRWKWSMDGVITQGFGCTTLYFEPYDPSCPSRHFHSGVDIATDWGAAVHAADGGIVHNFTMVCSWDGSALCGYGRYVIIVHASGFTSLYGHLSGWAIADGTQVNQDTVIGYEGSTGASTGPHLHFEIDLNGFPVDPFAYLP